MARKMIWTIAFGVLFGASLGFSQDSDTGNAFPSANDSPAAEAGNSKPDSAVRLSGSASNSPMQNKTSLFFALDEGQAMRGIANAGSKYATISRSWQQRMYLDLTNDLTYQERLRFILSFECQLTFSFMQTYSLPATLAPLFSFYPSDVEVSYTFGNLEKPWMNLAVGYFPFKYNPDAKDLGEYLLRSIAYPTFIVNNFEFPLTRELGLHVSGNSGWLINPAIDKIQWDVLFTSETHSYSWPTQDWTLSLVASNNLFNFLEIGGGVSWQRLFSVNDSLTAPKDANNRYFGPNGQLDTNYLSFKATKLMGRASINPQRFIPEFKVPFWPLFGETPFFGKNDFKVYGEVAVLGLDNYIAYGPDSVVVDSATGQKAWLRAPRSTDGGAYGNFYDSLCDRMPYMVGINLPTHPLFCYGVIPLLLTKWLKDETGDDIRTLSYITLVPALASGVLSHFLGWDLGLDEFSLEFEWASQRYANSDFKAIDFSNGYGPMPLPVQTASLYVDPMKVKYALYFKKSFMDKRFAISGLVARDHMRPVYHGQESIGVTDDLLQGKNQWWWTLRLSANF
jgi:hypothetical protein